MTSWAKSIGTSADIGAIQADPSRKSFAVFNKHSTAILYMKEGREVSVDNGIPIYPKGNISLNTLEDGETVKESWSLISDTLATPIVIFEGA